MFKNFKIPNVFVMLFGDPMAQQAVLNKKSTAAFNQLKQARSVKPTDKAGEAAAIVKLRALSLEGSKVAAKHLRVVGIVEAPATAVKAAGDAVVGAGLSLGSNVKKIAVVGVVVFAVVAALTLRK